MDEENDRLCKKVCLNGCPAERAGGLLLALVLNYPLLVSMDARPSARADLPTHKSFFSSSLEGQTGGPHAFARGLPAKKWGSDDSGF